MFVSVFGKAATSTFTLKYSTGGAISTTYQFERSPAPAKLVYIKAEMDYISESSPDADGPMTAHIDEFTQTDHYEYILELDSQGQASRALSYRIRIFLIRSSIRPSSDMKSVTNGGAT